MKLLVQSVVAGLVLVSFSVLPSSILAQIDDQVIIDKALARIKRLAVSEDIVNAVREQNKLHQSMSQSDIDTLDAQWMAERKVTNQPLIQKVMANKTSVYLVKTRKKSRGLYKEILVMDARGLLVGASDITSDYWQGDEDKWTKTYLEGPDAYFIDELKQDDSTGTYQLQISHTIKDPDTGQAIGTVTAGISLDL